MADPGRFETFIGLDIGRINTRVSVFGISEGRYRLQGCEKSYTDFGYDGHLAAGVQQALAKLQTKLDRHFLRPAAIDAGRIAFNHGAVEQVGLTLSAFPPVDAAILGLTARGSLAAGLELAGKLPVQISGAYGSADLADEPAVIDALLDSRPEILILTGGTDSGEGHLASRWVEVARMLCRVLPEPVRPAVFFAGNPELHSNVRRRLEPVCRLRILPNLQPIFGEQDDVPAQAEIGREILSLSMMKLPGLQGLSQLAGDLIRTRGLMLDRMVRFFSRTKTQRSKDEPLSGVLAIDLGAGSTMVCVGRGGRSSAYRSQNTADWPIDPDFVHRWTAAPVRRLEVEGYLANQRFFPGILPQSLTELAMSQSLARAKIRSALIGLASRQASFGFDPDDGLMGHQATIFASGAALTGAPTWGQAMLILLDSLRPWQETTMILDQHHILPMLGLLAEAEPLLPVQVLGSDAFVNLGTVIPVVSQAQEGVLVLSVKVSMDSGKAYSVDIPQGALRRLLVPAGEAVTLTLDPALGADIGAGPGVSRQTRVTGGALGVVIDARGRPLRLPEKDEERIEHLRHWLWSLGG